jgi:hypothetical protein
MGERGVMMKIHELKILHKFCKEIVVGAKSFEIRKNDRNFQVGDILHLKEIGDNTGKYTGFEMFLRVLNIHQELGLEDGYVCMSIKRIDFVDMR